MPEKIDSLQTSPIPPQPSDPIRGKVLCDFYTALKAVEKGSRITRVEWQDANVYGFLKSEMLHIHRKVDHNDLLDHVWKVNLGDMVADDWIILD